MESIHASVLFCAVERINVNIPFDTAESINISLPFGKVEKINVNLLSGTAKNINADLLFVMMGGTLSVARESSKVWIELVEACVFYTPPDPVSQSPRWHSLLLVTQSYGMFAYRYAAVRLITRRSFFCGGRMKAGWFT